MKAEKTRIGVVGTGVMGGNHMRVLAADRRYSLTCAMDIDPDNLHAACQPYSDIFALHDPMAMLPYVDAVVIATPTLEHLNYARLFLNAGKHVLIEKPLASSLQEAREIVELAEKTGLVAAVGHLERFNPAIEAIKELALNPLFIDVQRLGSFSPRSLDIDVVLDLMIHDLDIIRQWDRSGIVEIRASGVPVISDKIDIANARIEFASGMVANITASRISQKKTRNLRIFKKKIYISVDYSRREVKLFRLEGKTVRESHPETRSIEPLANMWGNFHEYLQGLGGEIVSVSQGAESLALALDVVAAIPDLEN